MPKKSVECAWMAPGYGDDSDDWGKKKAPIFDKEFSMMKGAILGKSGFDDTLELSLSKIYCTKFNTFGRFCDPKH